MIKHISFSAWNLWRECQWRFKVSEMDGNRVPVRSVHMDFGTAIHESIESYRCKKLDERVTVDAAQELFEKKFRDLRSTDPNKDKPQVIEDMVVAGRRILTSLHKCKELEEASVMFNELPLYEKIERSDDLDIKFKGFIDIVIRTKDKRGKTILYVCDFKTCSWGWDAEKRRDRQTASQLFLYKYYFCKKFDVDPDQVKVAFVLLKKRPRFKDKLKVLQDEPVEWFHVSAGDVSVQRAVDSLNSDITEMKEKEETGAFVKNRKACKNQFGDTCPYHNSPKCPSDK